MQQKRWSAFRQELKTMSIKSLWQKSNTALQQLMNEPEQIALATFIGVFIGCSPFHGFKYALALIIPSIIQANRILTFGWCYITSFTVFMPLLIFVSHEFGALVLQNGNHITLNNEIQLNLDFIKLNLLQQLAGGICFALLMATLISIVFFAIFTFRKNRL